MSAIVAEAMRARCFAALQSFMRASRLTRVYLVEPRQPTRQSIEHHDKFDL